MSFQDCLTKELKKYDAINEAVEDPLKIPPPSQERVCDSVSTGKNFPISNGKFLRHRETFFEMWNFDDEA